MWWKLGGLLLVTVVLIVIVLPMRTHAVSYDAFNEQAPARPSLLDAFGNMYLTPASGVIVVAILATAGFVAMKIMRGQW